MPAASTCEHPHCLSLSWCLPARCRHREVTRWHCHVMGTFHSQMWRRQGRGAGTGDLQIVKSSQRWVSAARKGLQSHLAPELLERGGSACSDVSAARSSAAKSPQKERNQGQDDSATPLPATPCNTASAWLGSPARGHSPSLLLGSAPSSGAEGQGGCAMGQQQAWQAGHKPTQGSSQSPAWWQGDSGGQAAGEKVVGQGL